MTSPSEALRDFHAEHAFFVGVDSDGCVFDTMELKHKECFVPQIVRHYELQAISKYAREAAEFVNLYSRWRGTNRFPGLVLTFDLLRERPAVQRRGVDIPHLEALRRFVESGKPLGNPALEEVVQESRDSDLEHALRWSYAVNESIAGMVRGVAPFPGVRECLDRLAPFADVMCVSATPLEALTKEWEEHDIARYARLIAGQEHGSKKEMLAAAAAAGYGANRLLMIGDAPGDLEAARANGALFFPIVPGEEEASWQCLLHEGIERFEAGEYAGDYEDRLVEHFLSRLPSEPPWQR